LDFMNSLGCEISSFLSQLEDETDTAGGAGSAASDEPGSA